MISTRNSVSGIGSERDKSKCPGTVRFANGVEPPSVDEVDGCQRRGHDELVHMLQEAGALEGTAHAY